MFSNGLFADRFVAIAATLRRMHRHDPRIGLIDPTDVLMQKRAYGIEPDPAFVAGGSDGRLSSLGAFRLAQLVASYLQDELAVGVFRPVFDREASGTLNANPQLKGSSGVLATKAVTGRCAKAYRIDARQTGGALIQASVLRRRYAGAQRVTLSGRYTTNWGFVQINQEIDRSEVERLEPGDVIEAFSDFELAGPVSNIAAVSLHATAVWTNDFVGLHSSRYVGGMGVPFSHKGRLRTPQFTLPTKLSKLHVSCQLHLVPGTDLKVGGWLDLRSVVLRKLGPAAAEHHDSGRDERAAAPEARSAV